MAKSSFEYSSVTIFLEHMWVALSMKNEVFPFRRACPFPTFSCWYNRNLFYSRSSRRAAVKVETLDWRKFTTVDLIRHRLIHLASDILGKDGQGDLGKLFWTCICKEKLFISPSDFVVCPWYFRLKQPVCDNCEGA